MNEIDYEKNLRYTPFAETTYPELRTVFDAIWIEIAKQPYKVENQKQSLFQILTALFDLYTSNGELNCVSVSRSSTAYSGAYEFYGVSWFTYKTTISQIDSLIKLGYITQKIGCNYGTYKRQTRIVPTEKLLDLFRKVNADSCAFVPRSVVVVVKDDKHNLKEYTLNPYLRDRIAKIENYNEFIKTHRISMADKSLNPYIHAVYSRGKITCGGRLYTGISYQGISSDLRHGLLIDNQKTVELDFSALHLNLLYSLEQIQYNGDPYSGICGENQELRRVAKFLILCAINAGSRQAAIYATLKRISEDSELSDISVKYGIDFKFLVVLYDIFLDIHSPIAKYAGSDMGIKLMRKDSDIMIEILSECVSRGIPAYPVHDSVIVSENHKSEVKTIMEQKYLDATGFKILVK